MHGGVVLLAALLLSPARAHATAGTVETDESPAVIRWAVRAEGDAPAALRVVDCTRVGYEVDVHGGTAIGTLTYAFSHSGENATTARFELTPPPTIEILGLTLEARSRLDELPVEPAALGGETRGRTPRGESNRRAGGPAGQGVSGVRSAPFEMPAEATFEVRTRFRLPLSVERGIFGLTLPPVLQEPALQPVFSTVSVSVHHEAPLRTPVSPTHQILVDYLGDRTVIEPVVPEFPASQAFALTFETGSTKEPTIVGRVRRDGEGHAIEILLDPPREPEKAASRAKQVLFVVDTSGSMGLQEKLDQARRAVGRSLESLHPSDRFNIIEFDDDVQLLSPSPIEPVSEGGDRVQRWLDGMKADGGTKLLPALAAALDQPDDAERHRLLVVVTDGILADEAPVLDLLRERLGERRLFVVGTGAAVRQETLLRLAEYGRGAAVLYGVSESVEEAVGDLLASIADPLGWDLQLDWDGGEVMEIHPSRLPDLYAGRPVRVLARVRGDLPSSLAVRVSTVDGDQRYRVALPPVEKP